jgi:hypothetical protein
MTLLTEGEFARICSDIHAERSSIIRHNPVGTPAETLLWMVLSVLVSYLSLSENETPCLVGRPNEETYRDAIVYVVSRRRATDFDAHVYLDQLLLG